MGNRPIETLREKTLSISIWPTRNGGYSLTFQKSIKKKDEDGWTYLPSKEKPFFTLYPSEIEIMLRLLEKAKQWSSGHNEPTTSAPALNIDDEELPF